MKQFDCYIVVTILFLTIGYIFLPVKAIAQCPDVFDESEASINYDETVVFIEGCSVVEYCMRFVNIDDDPVNDIAITFVTSSNSATNFSIPVNLGGFTESGIGVYSHVIDLPATSELTLCISFRIDEAYSEQIDDFITASVTITPDGCTTPEVFGFSNFFPGEIEVAGEHSEITLLSAIAIQDEPFEPGLWTSAFSQSIGQSVLIRGTLLVDQDYWFPHSRVYMDDGASIIVREGSHLHFLGESQTTSVVGCSEMWDNIIVEEGASLTIDKALVRDGTTAIIAEDGSTVRITNTNFLNNWTGIHTPVNPSQNDIALNIYDNVFEVESFLPPLDVLAVQQGLAGLQLNDLKFALFTGRNTYRNVHWGIVSNNCTIITNKDFFEDNATGISATGSGHALMQFGKGKNANNPTFLNCYQGIDVINMHASAKLNAMRGVENGIAIRNGILKNFDFTDNIIKAARTGIRVNNYRPNKNGTIKANVIEIDGLAIEGTAILAERLNGLGIQQSHQSLIEDNVITLKKAKNGIWLLSSQFTTAKANNLSLDQTRVYHGIRMESGLRNYINCNLIEGANTTSDQWGIDISESYNTILGCNTLDNTRTGLRFIGSNLKTDLKGNEFNGHHYGLQVGQPISQSQYLTGFFDPVAGFRGNRWVDTYTGGALGAIHFGSSSDVDNSRLIVNPNAGAEFDTNDDPEDFVFPGTGDTYTCASDFDEGCPPPNFVTSVTSASIKIARGELTPGMFEDAQTWTAQRQLYRLLLEEPDLMQQDTNFGNFMLSVSASSVSAFENIRVDMEAMFDIDSTTQIELARNHDTIVVKAGELLIVDSLLQLNPSTQDSLDLEEGKVNLLGTIDSLLQVNLSIDEDLVSNRLEVAGDIYDDNNAVTTTEVFETNQKIVNRIILLMIIQNQNGPDSAQKVYLEQVAYQCPYAGGEAVYQARAMLSDTVSFDDIALCDTSSQQLLKPKPQVQPLTFRLYPNPSKGYTIIEMERGAMESGEVFVYNSLGVKVHTEPFKEGTAAIFLDFSGQPGGIYYLTIRTKSSSSSSIFFNLR